MVGETQQILHELGVPMTKITWRSTEADIKAVMIEYKLDAFWLPALIGIRFHTNFLFATPFLAAMGPAAVERLAERMYRDGNLDARYRR